MPELSVIKTKDQKQNENAVERARELLRSCESGECEEFVAVAIAPSGNFWHIRSGGTSSVKTAGILLSAAVEVLGFRPAE